VRRIDTHGAAVFLAGPDVYKIKRPVRYPYLDFSTLEKRRAACMAEVEINRRTAPEIYLGVVPITRDRGGLHLDGPGEVVEWAVHMRRFDENATLDRVIERGPLDSHLVDALAAAIAASHRDAPVRDGTAATQALGQQLESSVQELAEPGSPFPTERATRYGGLARAAFARVENLLLQRGALGMVRRCHGDLHLRNIVLLDGRPVLFDAIEFDETIATTDVLYDLAFMLMDLCGHDARSAARQLLDRYIWLGDDPARQIAGLAALPLFLSLRAAIRAKVGAERLRIEPGSEAVRRQALAYFDAALDYLAPVAPVLVAVGGLSGTGKSTLAATLAPSIGLAPGALHIRSDVVRKRLMGVAETTRLPEEAYRPEVSDRVRARMDELARIGLSAGRAVVVDATHQSPESRAAIADLAHRIGVPFVGLWLDAPIDTLRQRVAQRTGDASDATVAVLEAQARKDTGPIDWHRLDAGMPLEALVAAALRRIASSG